MADVPYSMREAVLRYGSLFGDELARRLDANFAAINPGGITIPLPINQGGTGATTPSGALANFGVSSIGSSLITSATNAQMRSVLGLTIGADVQAYSSVLQALTGTTTFGLNFALAADAAAGRTLLGLATIASTGAASDLVGNLPVSKLAGGTGASATTFWRGDGVWATPAGGGSGSPGGSNGQLQYNDAGAFAGLTVGGDATLNTGTGALTLANTTVTPGSYVNANITVDSKGRVTAATNGSGGGGSVSVAVLQEQQPSGTTGSNLSSTTWNTRPLNAKVDPDSIVTLDDLNNQFALAAGAYLIEGVGTCRAGSGAGMYRWKSRIRNVSDGVDIGFGPNLCLYCDGASNRPSAETSVSVLVVILSTKTFSFDTYSQSTTTTGDGIAIGVTEIFSTVTITKLA